MTQSTYPFPSASIRVAPRPFFTQNGWPPTDANERTGDDTPPGMRFFARAKRASDWIVLRRRFRTGRAKPAFDAFIGNSYFLRRGLLRNPSLLFLFCYPSHSAASFA